MSYSKFEVAIVGSNLSLKFIEVMACDANSAIADINEAFANPEIVSITLMA